MTLFRLELAEIVAVGQTCKGCYGTIAWLTNKAAREAPDGKVSIVKIRADGSIFGFHMEENFDDMTLKWAKDIPVKLYGDGTPIK